MKDETKKEVKHQKILEAAVDLFQRSHDIKRVSLEAIARQAGVSPTTIYNHFSTREELIFEVLKHITSRTIDRNRELIRSDMPFPQKLISIISGKKDLVDQVHSEIVEKMLSQDGKIAPFVDEIYQQDIRPLWREMLADGKRQGYIDPALDEDALLIYLDIIKDGLSVNPGLMKDFKEKMGLIEQVTRLMFYGFLKKEIDLFQKGDK
jgi:AcrR family transcriptional regulator